MCNFKSEILGLMTRVNTSHQSIVVIIRLKYSIKSNFVITKHVIVMCEKGKNNVNFRSNENSFYD